jgi:hypothetical protein
MEAISAKLSGLRDRAKMFMISCDAFRYYILGMIRTDPSVLEEKSRKFL